MLHTILNWLANQSEILKIIIGYDLALLIIFVWNVIIGTCEIIGDRIWLYKWHKMKHEEVKFVETENGYYSVFGYVVAEEIKK